MPTMVVILYIPMEQVIALIYECPWCPRLIQVHYVSTFNPRRFPIFPYYGFQRLISCRERNQIWRQRLQNVVDGD